MARAKWCEACQDHYEVHHFDEDGNHLVGAEYGWVGAMDARMRDLTAEVERLRAEVAGHLLRSDSLRAKLARQQDENERLKRAVQAVRLRADSLRAELRRTQDENERLYDELPLGQDEAIRLRAAVQAVRDLHCKATDEDDHDWCEECADLSDGEMSYWPCSTIVALAAALGGERDE